MPSSNSPMVKSTRLFNQAVWVWNINACFWNVLEENGRYDFSLVSASKGQCGLSTFWTHIPFSSSAPQSFGENQAFCKLQTVIFFNLHATWVLDGISPVFTMNLGLQPQRWYEVELGLESIALLHWVYASTLSFLTLSVTTVGVVMS